MTSDTYNFSDLELIDKSVIGPLSLEEWLEYNSMHNLNTNNTLDKKMDILTKYPRFKEILVTINRYKKDDTTGIKNISYSITEHIPKKPIKQKDNLVTDRGNKIRNDKNSAWKTDRRSIASQNTDWRQERETPKSPTKKGFQLFSISTSSINKINTIKVSKDDDSVKKDKKQNTIVVKNIPNIYESHDIVKSKLKELLHTYGEIAKIDILDNRRKKLMAFIDFHNYETVKTILEKGRTHKFRLGKHIIDICEKRSK